jgi:Sec-independent protein translocase protein TatA
VDGTAIIIILAIAGVASVLLFAIKGILDQLPDVFDSAGRARDAWEQFKKKQDEEAKPADTEEPPPVATPVDDEEPPVAA